MWLSFSMTMDERSWRWGSMPPTIMPYFSTMRKPAAVSESTHRAALTRRRLARAGNHAAPALLAGEVTEPARDGRDAGSAGKQVEADTLAEQQVARLAAHDGHLGLGAVWDHSALGDEPLDAGRR